ncbi:hypothetical protein DFR50_109161 [Roseiarcus fermentans]|uniref:EamA-like transporter family protein n=1 Tax=Roseiarcus fermentans TaxID=1473586 RepID=A0A366FIJ5_9HYPH|nr:hypothetical protein [Roseiarcus fermentans]RBP14407.1 hypothetical protein DFR50_109161 [Roseiarcus fermentans]
MRRSELSTDYRIGTLYALVTAMLYAVQEPFSFPAAHGLSTVQFVCLTQIALFVSIPLVTFRAASRRDLLALLAEPENYARLAVIFAVGLSGLLLYNVGLSDANPIIVSAVLNLLPFWAALVALAISGVPIPVSPAVFFSCFLGAFLGAMMVAWSQVSAADQQTWDALVQSLFRGSWIYALPVPVCTALGGTLMARWFAKYDEAAAVAANFLFANVLLIPATLVFLYRRSELGFDGAAPAVALMFAGTIVAASVGRIVFQIALTATGGDNGFVSMFLNLVPALTALVSFVLVRWIPDLRFAFDGRFFLGLALIVASLALFSARSWRAPARGG